MTKRIYTMEKFRTDLARIELSSSRGLLVPSSGSVMLPPVDGLLAAVPAMGHLERGDMLNQRTVDLMASGRAAGIVRKPSGRY